MKPTITPAGLFLWNVELANGGPFSLWITTRTRSAEKAASKAQRFVKRALHKTRRYPRATITKVSSNGTIDA